MYFEERDFATAVRSLTGRMRFPINNFNGLRQGVGPRIQIANQSISLDDLKQLAEHHHQPTGWFPFTHSQDVLEKARRFYSGLGSDGTKFGAGEDIWGLPKRERIPFDQLPFPENLKNVKHKTREPGAVDERIEREDVS